MNHLHKAIQVAAGISVFWIAYWLLTSNQIVTEYLRPSVESGQLGSASGNALALVIEILASIGVVVLATVTRLLKKTAELLEPFARSVIDPDSPQPFTATPQNDPQRLIEDLSRLLIQAVLEGDRGLTVELAHRIAKKEFLTSPKEQP